MSFGRPGPDRWRVVGVSRVASVTAEPWVPTSGGMGDVVVVRWGREKVKAGFQYVGTYWNPAFIA
jgi:hypothetical protein